MPYQDNKMDNKQLILYLWQNKEMQKKKYKFSSYYIPICLSSTVPEQWYDLLAVEL